MGRRVGSTRRRRALWAWVAEILGVGLIALGGATVHVALGPMIAGAYLFWVANFAIAVDEDGNDAGAP